MNLRWPATATNGMVPWYVIAWRIMCCPVVLTGMGIVWFGILLTHGLSEANRAWNRVL